MGVTNPGHSDPQTTQVMGHPHDRIHWQLAHLNVSVLHLTSMVGRENARETGVLGDGCPEMEGGKKSSLSHY